MTQANRAVEPVELAPLEALPGSAIATVRAGALALVRLLARLAFAGAVITLPFRGRAVLLARPLPPVYSDFTDFLLYPSDALVILTLSFWLLSLLLQKRRVARGPDFLFWPIVAFTGAGLASTAFSVDPPLSLYHSIRLVLLAGVYLYVVNEIKTPYALVIPVAAQIVIQAWIGIAQVTAQHSLSLQALGELELDPVWQGVSIVSTGGVRLLRAYGLADHPNILGGSLAFAMILVAMWQARLEARWRSLSGMVFALGAAALLLTFSRSAWVAFGGGALVAIVLLAKSRQSQALWSWLALLGAALILLVPLAWQYAGYLSVRLNYNASFANVVAEERSLVERSVLNDEALRILSARPLTGVGLGAFPSAFRVYAPDYPLDYQPPHIVLLEAAAEIGVPGAAFYFVALLGPWLALIAHRRRLTITPSLIAASGILAAVTIVGFFDYYTWLSAPGRLWQWMAWGLWGASYLSGLDGAADSGYILKVGASGKQNCE